MAPGVNAEVRSRLNRLWTWAKGNAPVLIMLGLLVGAGAATLSLEPAVKAVSAGCGWSTAPPETAPATAAPATTATATAAAAAPVAEVADAVGGSTISIMTHRISGKPKKSTASPLAIQGDRTLPGGTVLTTTATELRRDDGQVLSESQVESRAEVSRDGKQVRVKVCVAPRLGEVSYSGKYVGSVSLDDPRARGATVPVTVHVPYPYLNRVLLWALVAGMAGLVWAWLMRHADQQINAESPESLVRTMVLQIASLLVGVPVVVTFVVSKPEWQGDLTAYIALATAVGAAVIAANPTFRALASRVTKTD